MFSESTLDVVVMPWRLKQVSGAARIIRLTTTLVILPQQGPRVFSGLAGHVNVSAFKLKCLDVHFRRPRCCCVGSSSDLLLLVARSASKRLQNPATTLEAAHTYSNGWVSGWISLHPVGHMDRLLSADCMQMVWLVTDSLVSSPAYLSVAVKLISTV